MKQKNKGEDEENKEDHEEDDDHDCGWVVVVWVWVDTASKCSPNPLYFLHGRQASNQFDSLRLSLQRGPKTTVPLVSSWLSNRAAGPEDPSIRGTSTARAQAVSPRTASARLQSAAMQVPDKFPRLANWHAEILCQLLGKKVRFALTLPSHLNNP